MRRESVLIGAVGLVVIWAVLPALGAVLGSVLSEAEVVLLELAPKVAVVAGLLALVLLCIPFTRHHAQGMLLGSVLLALGATGVTVGVTWLQDHGPMVTAGLLKGANVLFARASGHGG